MLVLEMFVSVLVGAVVTNLGVASSYEEETVYIQAKISLSYKPLSTSGSDSKEVGPDPLRYVGKYGKNSPIVDKEGDIVWFAGLDWCKPVEMHVPDTRWIALIPRGNCSYKIKILLAKSLNASAVLIYDFVEGNNVPLPTMDHSGTGDIVAAIISLHSGKSIIEKKEQSLEPLFCSISVGTQYVDRRWKVSRTSVLFVLVSFILLMCISLAWLVFYYVQRFRYIYRSDRKEKQLLNAAKKAISKLKTRPFHASSVGQEEEELCVVCLENYKINETLRILPCNHEFHKNCIDPWLLNHRTCPMCKSNILKSLGVDIPVTYNHSDAESGSSSPNLSDRIDPASAQLDSVLARVADGPGAQGPTLDPSCPSAITYDPSDAVSGSGVQNSSDRIYLTSAQQDTILAQSGSRAEGPTLDTSCQFASFSVIASRVGDGATSTTALMSVGAGQCV